MNNTSHKFYQQFAVFLLLLFVFSNNIFALTLQSVSPTPDSGGVSIDFVVTAEFNDTLDLSHMSASDRQTFNEIMEVFLVKDNYGESPLAPIRITGTGSISGAILTFDPYDNLAYISEGSQYRVVLSTNIKDTDGNPLPEEYIWYFTTIYDSSEDNTVIGSDGITKAVIPAGALTVNGYVVINIDTAASATLATPAELAAAHNAALSDLDPYVFPINSTMKEFVVYTGSNTLFGDGILNKNCTVYLPYPDADNNRFVDGTHPPVREENLVLYYFNTGSKRWIPVDNISIDRNSKLISASVSRLSIFVLMGRMNAGLKDAYAYPVPFMPNSNPNHSTITFTNLLPDSRIEIFTVTGKKVNELISDTLGLDVSWDGRNSDSQNLSSGAYIFRISRGGDSKSGRLMIIR